MSKQKKILVVAESIDVEDSSGSKANVGLIENLHVLGYGLHVYHYTKKDIQLPGINCVLIKEKKWNGLYFLSRTERFFRNKLKIDVHRPLEKLFGFSFTLFNDRNSIVSSLRNFKAFEPDLIITLSKGGSFRPHHALLKMPEHYHRWMAYIHDPYPMHLYPRPYIWVEPGHYQKWKFMKAISERAAFPAFPSELLKQWMGSFFKEYDKKGIVIPHQITKFHSQKEKILDYINRDKFTLLHAGNLLNFRNPEGLITAVDLFLSRNNEAKGKVQLIFIGEMTRFYHFLKKKEKEMPEVLTIGKKISYESVNYLQRLVSVNVILEAKSEISPFLPGKFPNCILAAKPILLLGPYYSESKRLLGNNYEYWSEIDDKEKIASHIENLYKQWLENKEMKLRREDLIEYLSTPFLKFTIDDLLNRSRGKTKQEK